jgi:DNA-binding NarL/FixJ family response regulator
MKKILKTKILLVDDHRLMRAGLRSILEKQPDMEILGEAQNGLVALRLAKELRPDLIIMDIRAGLAKLDSDISGKAAL